jgi:hypothetical protein
MDINRNVAKYILKTHRAEVNLHSIKLKFLDTNIVLSYFRLS